MKKNSSIFLAVGQIWSPSSQDNYTLEIVKLSKKNAKVKQIETGEIYYHELNGSDGFVDYLIENCYSLK